MPHIIFLPLLLLLASAVSADAYWEQRLLAQLNEAAVTEHERFAYTQVVSSDEEIEISEFQPNATPKWQLISVNGAAPNDKQTKKFLKQKQREADSERTFADIVQPGSVVLVEQNAQAVVVEFRPQVERMSDKSAEALVGRAVFAGDREQLQRFSIVNRGEFSPILSMKIEQFNMGFEFVQVDGQTLPKHLMFVMNGKLAGLKRIDVDSKVEYRNYSPLR